MTKTNHDIDEMIREALSDEDAKLFDEFGDEPSLLEMTLQTLTGRHRWVNTLAAVALFILLLLGLYCAWQFFQTDATDIKSLFFWVAGFGFCMTSVTVMKVWYWLLINKNDTTREIKRLELQVARLASKREANL